MYCLYLGLISTSFRLEYWFFFSRLFLFLRDTDKYNLQMDYTNKNTKTNLKALVNIVFS